MDATREALGSPEDWLVPAAPVASDDEMANLTRAALAEVTAAEAVIEAARALYDAPCGMFPAPGTNAPCGDLLLAVGDALRGLDTTARKEP